MPKSVLQSNWYYGADFGQAGKISPYVKMYDSLETHGFDQIPTGSNTQSYAVKEGDLNIEATVDYCTKAIDPSRLLGFMVAAWRPTLAPCLETHKAAISQLGKAMKKVKK
jgi:hypothetical protein